MVKDEPSSIRSWAWPSVSVAIRSRWTTAAPTSSTLSLPPGGRRSAVVFTAVATPTWSGAAASLAAGRNPIRDPGRLGHANRQCRRPARLDRPSQLYPAFPCKSFEQRQEAALVRGDKRVALRHIGALVGQIAHRRLWPEILAWVHRIAQPGKHRRWASNYS